MSDFSIILFTLSTIQQGKAQSERRLLCWFEAHDFRAYVPLKAAVHLVADQPVQSAPHPGVTAVTAHREWSPWQPLLQWHQTVHRIGARVILTAVRTMVLKTTRPSQASPRHFNECRDRSMLVTTWLLSTQADDSSSVALLLHSHLCQPTHRPVAYRATSMRGYRGYTP